MDKKYISDKITEDILLAMGVGNRKVVDAYVKALRKEYAQIRGMEDWELKPLLPLVGALIKASKTYFRQLVDIAGVRLLILAVRDGYSVFEELVAEFDEDYIAYIYSALEQTAEADAQLVHHCKEVFAIPAERAGELHKEQAMLAIYEAEYCLYLPFYQNEDHPISAAARTNNLIRARAYIMAGRKTGFLNYDRPDGCSVLMDVLKSDKNVELLRLCLDNEANVEEVMLPSGESLWDAASGSEEMQNLILTYGGKPAEPALCALYKTVHTMTTTTVNTESFAALLEDCRYPYCHTYQNGSTPFSKTHNTDVFLTAARRHNTAALRQLLPRLGSFFRFRGADAVDQIKYIKELLYAIFHAEYEADRVVVPAETTIALLQMLIDEGVRFPPVVNCNKMPSEDADGVGSLGIMEDIYWIMQECRYACYYTPEACKMVTALLWEIGGNGV